MLRSTSVVITTIGASASMALSPVSSPTLPYCSREIPELLVGERLERGGVERPPTGLTGAVDAVLGDHGLAAAGRCGDDDVLAGVERLERIELEPVELEREAWTVHAVQSPSVGGQVGATVRRRLRRSMNAPNAMDRK